MLDAVERAISPDYLRMVVERLAGLGSSPLGFRVAGTPEERRATRWLAGELRSLGLTDVVEEPVPVDAWRFREAFVELDGGPRFEAASMGGVPGTAPHGVSGELVFVRRGGRRELDGIDVRGKIVLVDWSDDRFWPYAFGLELGLRGATAVVVACFDGGPWYQAAGALGTFDAMWHEGAPPLAVLRKEDAAELAARAGARTRVVVRATLKRAEAANVVGILPGRRRVAPVVVGGHHDGWFDAAFDDATGVAVTLALARAFADAGVRPPRPIAFVSHTAEEYGIAWTHFDWCYGAWYQILAARRDWAGRAPFYLNVEGSGLPYRLRADAPPELGGWVRGHLRRAARDGLLPHGFAVARPNTYTEVWTFLAAGVPGINVSSFADPWYRTAYHTQYDTIDHVDFDYLAKLARLFARLLWDAAEAPDAILAYPARAADLRARLERVSHTPARDRLERSLERLERLGGRRAFTGLGRGLTGLDAHAMAAYPHEQAARDVDALERALAALQVGRRAEATRRLELVGLNRLCAHLSREAFTREHRRFAPDAPRACWGRQGRIDPGPNLWDELSAIRNEPGTRPHGPWVRRSLERHLARRRSELSRRLDHMAAAVEGRVPPLVRIRKEDLPS
jgi:Iap family predicted aminopeptidase